MSHQESQFAADPALPRLGIAVGFAALASLALALNVSAAVPQPAAHDTGATAFAYQWTGAVDWERVAPSHITPAETVGAYER
ncbi:MAG: hypothetical protein KF788_18785 [Piscinibacter sp.]|nr:hypothetical protein [Piscinibacter sp.]